MEVGHVSLDDIELYIYISEQPFRQSYKSVYYDVISKKHKIGGYVSGLYGPELAWKVLKLT